jgi:Hg(II)-responsive transcriptional regulator
VSQKTIGWVAKEAGVNAQTVLYYERRALLPAPARCMNGYRLFNDASVRRIRFIKRAQELGFTLKQVKALLTLQGEQDASCAEVSAMAASHLEDIEAKIHDLERMRKTLTPLVEACPKKGALKTCPIMDSLDNPNDKDIS